MITWTIVNYCKDQLKMGKDPCSNNSQFFITDSQISKILIIMAIKLWMNKEWSKKLNTWYLKEKCNKFIYILHWSTILTWMFNLSLNWGKLIDTLQNTDSINLNFKIINLKNIMLLVHFYYCENLLSKIIN